MMRYKVLWIDDEIEKQDAFIDIAYRNGIDLNEFSTSREGIADLIENLNSYVGIILDAKVFNDSIDEVADIEGLYNSICKIRELRSKRFIPVFVFTGQPDLMGNAMFQKSLSDIKIFKKGLEINELLAEVKSAADQLIETQIKHKYANAFEACIDHYIGLSAEKLLMKALLIIEDGNETVFKEDSYTDLRKIFELLFDKLNKLNIIPDSLFKGKGWMNGCSRYLNRESSEFILNEGVIHPLAAYMQKLILNILQDASHEISEKLNLKVGQFVNQNKTGYLFKGIVYQVIDLLIYFRHFIDEHPDPKANRLLWKEIAKNNPNTDTENWIKGIVIKIAENGYGTFQPDDGSKTVSIIPVKVNELNLKEGNNIEITATFDEARRKTLITQLRKLQ
jgi:hypothetical protein